MATKKSKKNKKQKITSSGSSGGASVGLDPSTFKYDSQTGEPLQDGYTIRPDGLPVNAPKKKSVVSAISTTKGKKYLTEETNKQIQDVTRLNTATKNQTQTSLLNQKNNKGNSQGYTFDELKSLGYDVNQATFDPASGTFTPSATSNDPYEAQKLETLNSVKKDLGDIDRVFSQQEKYLDRAATESIRSIRGLYEQRAQEQKNLNARQLQRTTTAGIRSGTAQYAQDIQQGIVNTEERAGLARLDEIASKQAVALAEAEQARIDKKYTLFADKRKEIADLKKEANNTIKELRDAAQKDKENKAKEAAETRKTINEVITDAAKNGAPSDVLASISKSQDLVTAVTAAGDYLQGGTGIIGEYQFYKRDAEARNLVPMTFNEYADIDANRKRIASQIVDDTGLTTQEKSQLKSITDKFQADGIMTSANAGKTAINIADMVIADPKSAGNQLITLYTLVKSLDPNSAVREGEISLAQETQSYLGKFRSSLEKINNGQVISPSAAVELAKATKRLANLWYEAGKRREGQYKSQADVLGVKDAFQKYLDNFERPYDTASKQITSEEDAKSAVIEYGANNPDKQDYIKKLSNEIQQETGRPLSWQEILQVLNIPKVKGYMERVQPVEEISINIPKSSRLAYTNNNPGNLRFVGQRGATRGENGFAKFASPEDGYIALKKQIDLDKSRKLTLKAFIEKYAPPTENDTDTYIRQMAKRLGINETTLISEVDTEELARAIAQKESSSIIA